MAPNTKHEQRAAWGFLAAILAAILGILVIGALSQCGVQH